MALSRSLHIPAIFLLFVAFVFLIIVSIGLPFLTVLDFVRIHFTEGAPTVGTDTSVINQLRFGSWAVCGYQISGDRACSPAHSAYTTTIYDGERHDFVHIASSWTRGLAIHPVAAGVTFIALLLSFSTHATARLLASLAAFLGATLALIAFLCDIALFAWVKHRVNTLSGIRSHTVPAPGFWLTFASILLLIIAGSTVCLGRRRDRLDGAKPNTSWMNRRFRFGRKTAV